MQLLQVDHISKQYNDKVVLHPFSCTVAQGERVAVVGETGSGKSSLLKILGGLVQPNSGRVLFKGRRVLGPDEQLLPGHPGIAYLSQHFELRNNYFVYDLLDYGSELTREEAMDLYAICQIDHLLFRKTNSGLSGGERQRIALAKLLSTKPKLLLLDEPFSNLDALHKKTIKQVIHDISEQLSITCIMVSHDAADTLSWAEKIYALKDGQLQQAGTPNEMYNYPANRYVAALFGEFNSLSENLVNTYLPQYTSQLQHSGQLLVRPGKWNILPHGNAGIPCKIQRAYFMGPFYLMQAVCPDNTSLLIQVNDIHYSPGDEISVSPTDATLHSF